MPGKRKAERDRIDVHVGARLRRRREVMALTQSSLADRLGISFQAVQKYEAGENRVSAATLWRIAEILDVPVGYFFEGLSNEGARSAAREERAALRIVKPLTALSPEVREQLTGFIAGLARVLGKR